jgi:regulator of sigma E protease
MNIILFILILAVLIVVHELGHFLVAKWSGVRVDEFGLGYPPRIFSFKPKKGETRYSLNVLPFGGFVSILGENPDEKNAGERSMQNKNAPTKIGILAGGVIFNIFFGWLLLSVGFFVGVPTSVTYDDPGLLDEAHLTILGTVSDSPSALSGLLPGDHILFVESREQALQGADLTVANFQTFVQEIGGDSMQLLVGRGEENQTITLIPEMGVNEGGYAIGAYLDVVGTVKSSFTGAFLDGAHATWNMLYGTVAGLGGVILGAFQGKGGLDQVTGPVGIVGLVGEVSSLGFLYLLSFTAFISINLAVINLIPFPALDGGRILFVLVESIKGGPIRPKIATTLNVVGFGLLILLMLVVTYNDIVRLF